MCDVCRDLIDLMVRYDHEINEIVPADDDDPDIRQPLNRHDVQILLEFFTAWTQRRCNCIFRDVRNVERLNTVIRGLLVTAATQLKCILKEVSEGKVIESVSSKTDSHSPASEQDKRERSEDKSCMSERKSPEKVIGLDDKVDPVDEANSDSSMSQDEEDEDDDEDEEMEEVPCHEFEETYCVDDSLEKWSLEERERLLILSSKVFNLHFPVYAVHHKHSLRVDDLSGKEATLLSSYCDLQESDVPLLLLRNISFFCQQDVLQVILTIFSRSRPQTLPLNLAHSIVAVISQVKNGLNVGRFLTELVSFRTLVIQYLCQVPDKDLRVPGLRNYFEFIWTVVKDISLDSSKTALDKEGLTLALKYFTSTTLIMRLTGISQINNYISMFTEYSQADNSLSPNQLHVLQEELTKWILSNKIIDHVFGPNLHVEVIKQSHVVLNFIVSHINCDHVDKIWAAAQLKHCSKQVHDLLSQLVKNMELKSVLHLYSLLRELEVKDHNENTLHLTSCILKFIWTRSLNIQEPVNPALNLNLSGLISSGITNTPVKAPSIFLMLPNQRSNDGESSSASADDEEEDDEDDYDVGPVTGPFPPNVIGSKPVVSEIQPSPGSSSCWSRSSEEVGNQVKNPKTRPPEEEERTENSDFIDSEDETVEVYEAKKRRTDLKTRKRVDDHSSQNSQSSVKRMSDFESEVSNDAEMIDQEEEDDVPAIFQPGVPSTSHLKSNQVRQEKVSPEVPSTTDNSRDPVLAQFSIDHVCVPGNTLLWDLLQDDKIDHLPEGLAQESEKVLCSLISWLNDRRVRMKFIEGCLANLERNTSVIVSLKLLPKLLLSFQAFRETGQNDIHQVTLWADSERLMLKHFFSNLVLYCESRSESPGICSSNEALNSSPVSRSRQGRLSHTEEIQIRLHFLSFIFSSVGSPETFMLNPEQLDSLWSCIANDNLCRDELFNWMITQIRSRDQHALSLDLYRHLLVEKMPQVKSENFSMLALELVHHLCMMFVNTTIAEEVIPTAIKLLWDIALTATNIDASMTATKYLNNYYIHSTPDEEGSLKKETEFIEQCMKFLRDSASLLKTDEEKHSTIIQRAMTLLKTHLEVFRMRYSFHLRKMQLEGETCLLSHRNKVSERSSQHYIRIIVQNANLTEKVHFDMQYTDFLGELRAEVSHWWQNLQNKYDEEGIGVSPEGPLRLLSQGQELLHEKDEKQLADLGFRDCQVIYVSVGAARISRKTRDSSEPASCLPPPPKHRIPLILLLNKSYFEQLFDLTQQLGAMTGSSHVRYQLLSRRVWEIIQMLPTSPDLLNKLQSLTAESTVLESEDRQHSPQQSMSLVLNDLLSPTNPQKLLYCVQIVDWLRRSYLRKDRSWAEDFIDVGGLQHIFDIFVSGVLQPIDSESSWNEWKQDCLATLLQLIFKFGTSSSNRSSSVSDMTTGSTSKDTDNIPVSRKKQRRKVGNYDKMLIHTFNDRMLQMLKDVETVLQVLLTILNESSCRSPEKSSYQTGFYGRAQIVHHTITFITSWSFSDISVGNILFKLPNFASILKKLVLDDPDPSVRREACSGFYRLCLGQTLSVNGTNERKGLLFIPSLLNSLLSFISVAQNMRPPEDDSESDEVSSFRDKESYGPGCKDYFWLVGRLLDSLDPNDKETVNIDRLCSLVASAIINREVRESRLANNEDEGLRGLLGLIQVAFKHDPPFKYSSEGKSFLLHVYDCLFKLPSLSDRNLPKCKNKDTRITALDLLIELCKDNEESYVTLVNLLLDQHKSSSHPSYSWEFWPHDDTRSDCGYVGLINLGATCYMASCLQHLFMIPDVRKTVLAATVSDEVKHEQILYELQRMFAALQESERKSYSPRSFCKVYTMDHELLNTGEQKDMTEFFTDLISKFEEMSDDLKNMVKTLFGGTLSNNVVSLDCPHISTTTEEFYTLRCKVADMRSLFDSLDDLTVKDTLEGDNMYTCSKCGKKVRAEKRACIKKLPRILCFNTMRYTFNMLTMTKEKVNTHFSFPLILNMNPYLEDNLIKKQEENGVNSEEESNDYELIGVTVHTGTAEGGHYYSFIRERDPNKDRDKWYMFNDAEVKYFDPSQLGSECFGGEMTSKTYDSATDKYMDFSFEKTNSAYMLFYERIDKSSPDTASCQSVVATLPPELSTWIWEDNTQFMRDRSIFEHSYFNFMYQVCSSIPTTLENPSPEVGLLTTKLGTTFLLETLIHAKEKQTIAQWIELMNKKFNANPGAGEWFFDYMAEDPHWPLQILLKCPLHGMRELFQRLCLHVVSFLRDSQKDRYLSPIKQGSQGTDIDALKHVGQYSCVTRFIKKLLSLLKTNAMSKPQIKHLTEYFHFLLKFAEKGEEECKFLLVVEAINTIVQFYLNHCKGGADLVDMTSEDEEEEEEDAAQTSFRSVTHLALDGKQALRPASLDKMVTLVAYLVEKSRGSDDKLHLSSSDHEVLFSGKMFPFIQRQIRDNINLKQTVSLIISFCRFNEKGAENIVYMLLHSINRMPESSGPFFKVLSSLVEYKDNDPPGIPNFGEIIFPRIWDIAEHTPQHSLEWLTLQVTRNKFAHTLVMKHLQTLVDFFLISHANQRVRTAASNLLISLVPSSSFRSSYNKSPRLLLVHHREPIDLNPEALAVVQRIFSVLLNRLKTAKEHADATAYGTSKLVSYFMLMSYCLVTKNEKLMLVPYFNDLWNLFQPKLSEPPVAVNQNKQALLHFWYNACNDCPENVRCIIQSPAAVQNIAFNYILADHEDQEIIMYNRIMLPSYYGILRLCCLQSRQFTRRLASHQNINWAFKNITPHNQHYQQASNELFKLMKIFVTIHPDSTEDEVKQIKMFKKQTIHMYLTSVDSRSNWSAMITGLQICMEDEEDKVFVLMQNGLFCLLQAFGTLFLMFHEATACHVTSDIIEVLKIVRDLLEAASETSIPEVKEWCQKWKDQHELIRKLVHLLNTYTTCHVRSACMNVLEQLIILYPKECIPLLVQCLGLGHLTFQDQHVNFSAGPYFPRRGQKVLNTKSSLRPPKAVFQMHFHQKMLEVKLGVDPEYDLAVIEYFTPYYSFIVNICRTAIRYDLVNQELVGLCSLVALESLPMRLSTFIAFFNSLLTIDSEEESKSENEFLNLLCKNCTNFRDFVSQILTQDRSYVLQETTFSFLKNMTAKIKSSSMLPQVENITSALISDIIRQDPTVHGIQDFQALLKILRCLNLTLLFEENPVVPTEFLGFLKELKKQIHILLQNQEKTEGDSPDETPRKKLKTDDLSDKDSNDTKSKSQEMTTEVKPADDQQATSSTSSSSSQSSISSQEDNVYSRIESCVSSIIDLLQPN